MNAYVVASTGFVQGLGTGFVFTPMTMVAFSTLHPSLRPDGTGVFTLARNLGNSAGISIMQTLFTRTSQTVHSRLVEPLTLDNPTASAPYLAAPFSLHTPSGIAALNGEVGRQAAMVAYVDVFHLMFLTTAVMIPLVLLLKPVAQSGPPSEDAVLLE
jgi:MFS transporter, DHA2 family, multidrug resistance protein